jgi:trk system potassium uptake protein TrkA
MAAVLIVGAGKSGTAIARAALAAGIEVRVLESRRDHIEELETQLGTIVTTHGSGIDPLDLERAGIRACRWLVAATGSDEVNLVTATLAKFEFRTAVVLARVVDPRNRWLFGPDMGVDHALDETQLMAEIAVEHLTP